MEKLLLAIPNRCTGCNRCTYVCSAVKEGMFIPSKARIKINNFPNEGYSVPGICFQCSKADCMKACPEDAIFKNEIGVIAIDMDKCTQCGECVDACPYGMMEQYESGIPYKCDLCDGSPACVVECNFGALLFTEPDKILRKLRGTQMKQRQAQGLSNQKRRRLAQNILKDAVRLPKTVNYMG